MKSTIVLFMALASMASAQPHNHQHQHLHRQAHNKRALVTSWTTEYETVTVTEYIDETTTSWVTTAPSTTVAPPKPAAKSSDVPGQFFQGASASSPPAAIMNTPPTPQAAPPANTPPPVAAPPPPPPPVPTVAAVAAPPPPPPASSPASGGGADKHTGELTFYDLGLGACGSNDGGADYSKNIVALSHELMGELSNSNPYCGKTITISYGGKTTTALVADKCMGCPFGNIDVSKKVFAELVGDEGKGRVNVDWWFN